MQKVGQNSMQIGSNGLEWNYRISFSPFSAQNIPGVFGKVGTAISALGFAVSAISPDKAGLINPYSLSNQTKCMTLDSKLEDEYAKLGYKPNNLLTRDQAKSLLDGMFKNHPEMKALYGSPDLLLNTAFSIGQSHSFNILQNQAQPIPDGY